MGESGFNDDYDGSARAVATVQSALRRLRATHGLSQETVAAGIAGFVDENPGLGPWRVPEISQQEIGRLLSRPPGARRNLPDLPRAAWCWLMMNYPAVLAECSRTTPTSVGFVNPVSAAVGELLNPDEAPDHQKVARMGGRYIAYRRFFLDPERVMVAGLECGDADDSAVFRMVMEYEGLGGDECRDTVEGYMIPYDDGVLFQGRFLTLNGPFVAAVTKLVIDPRSNQYGRGEGAVLAGAQGDHPSAYPILILRTQSPVKPGIFETNILQQDRMLWPLLEPMLERGFIDWRS